MKEKVLLVGGATNQCHIIDFLKEEGYHVIVVDYDVECMGSRIADEFYSISTSNVDAIIELAKEKKVRAVLAVQSDLGIVTASIVADRLGLKGLPIEKVNLFSNKYRMREYLKENNFPYPNFKKCRNEKEVHSFGKTNGFPFVMKPLDAQGSRGVEIINSDVQIKKIHDTIKFSRNEKAVLVEDYLGKDEYTVEGIVINGEHKTLAISRKTHYQDLECVSCELYYSWENDYQELVTNHNALINSTEIPFGITHSEYIKNEKGFVLVEFSARGGGAMISSHIVPAVSGWDVENIFAKQMLDIPFELPPQKKNCAVLKFINLEHKKIVAIKGIAEIQQIKNVLHLELKYEVGQQVQHVINDTNRHGFFIAWAENRDELDKVINQVEQTLKIEYEVE